jgi:hypothetical protein
MFKKIGVVLLLVMCLVGFCINPVSAKDDNFGTDYFGNVNFNVHDKSNYAIHWVWFRIFEKVAENKYIVLYDLRWDLDDELIDNIMERDLNIKFFQDASNMLNIRNKTYYADVGVSYYDEMEHRKNSKGYIELDTNKFYDIKATFDTNSNNPRNSPKISLNIKEYNRVD